MARYALINQDSLVENVVQSEPQFLWMLTEMGTPVELSAHEVCETGMAFVSSGTTRFVAQTPPQTDV